MSSYFEPALTAAQTANIANVDVAVSSRAPARTTNAPLVKPNLAASAQALPNAAAWTYGAWVTLTAANSIAVASGIIGLMMWSAQTGLEFQVQLGTGAAGSEVGIGEFPLRSSGAADDAAAVPIPIVPSLAVGANARIAFRCASNSGGGAVNMRIVVLPAPF